MLNISSKIIQTSLISYSNQPILTLIDFRGRGNKWLHNDDSARVISALTLKRFFALLLSFPSYNQLKIFILISSTDCYGFSNHIQE